jgi:hypothetical protein
MRQCEELQEQRDASYDRNGREARASTTDLEARVMMFPDGGNRPGYNKAFSACSLAGPAGCEYRPGRGNLEIPPQHRAPSRTPAR